MRSVQSHEIKDRWDEVLAHVERDHEEIGIVRDGKTVARLVPTPAPSQPLHTPDQRRAAMDSIRALNQQIREAGNGLSVDEIIRLKNQGRRL